MVELPSKRRLCSDRCPTQSRRATKLGIEPSIIHRHSLSPCKATAAPYSAAHGGPTVPASLVRLVSGPKLRGDAPTVADRAHLCVRKARMDSAGGPERLNLAQQGLCWLHWGKHWRNEHTLQSTTSLYCQELRGPWPTWQPSVPNSRPLY